MWDYKTWANAVKSDFSKVTAYRSKLIEKEEEFIRAFEQVEEGIDPDSVNIQDISLEASQLDEHGSAIFMLNFRSGQLEVSRLINPILNKHLADKTNIFVQHSFASIVMKELEKMTKNYSDLSSSDRIQLAINRYPKLLEKYYGGISGYEDFVQNLGIWLDEKIMAWEIRMDSLFQKERYAVYETDRIPLFQNSDSLKYRTLIVNGDENKVAAGIDIEKSRGYVVWSGPERSIGGKIYLKSGDIDVKSTSAASIPMPNFAFYFYDELLTKNNLLITATGDVGQIKWSKLITAPRIPASFRYDETLDQLVVFYFPEDQLPDGDIVSHIVIDKMGTIR